MSQEINDVAILLTQKIEHDLVYEFVGNKTSPSFYNIRDTIYRTLANYIDVLRSEEISCPDEIGHLKGKQLENYLQHKLEVQAAHVGAAILKNKDIVKKFELNKEIDRYKTIVRYIPVIKLNKVVNETDDNYFKGRF